MINQPIYIKQNKTRKAEYTLRTEIIEKDSTLFVRKVSNQDSQEFLKSLLSKYKKLRTIKTDLHIIEAKQINEFTIEFPYIQGSSLLEKLSIANTKSSFLKILDGYVEIIKKLPGSKKTLTKDFEEVFGKYTEDFSYSVVESGLLDITLENLIEDTDGRLHLIDYEWTFDFPIPKDFVIYRSLLYANTNLNSKIHFQLDELLNKYLDNKDLVDEYKNWELNFQREVSRNLIPQNALDLLENSQSKNPEILDIKELIKQRDSALRQRDHLEKELNNIHNGNYLEIANEYLSFQRTKIWKGLAIYRKLKRYSINFFKNILKDGPIITFKRIYKRILHVIEYRREFERKNNPYKYWLINNKPNRSKIKNELSNLEYQPLISIVMPVYNVDVKWIKEAIKSIKKQFYTNWELCIADDASTNEDLRKYLKTISKEEKIHVVFRKKNGHISEATNSALKLANGEFIAFMDNDDILQPHALSSVIKVLNEDKDTDFIYSDEDKIDMDGKRVEPFFKPDWSPDLFMSTNYLSHLSVVRKILIDSVGGLRKGYEGAQDYDLYLRITEKTNKIKHISDVLYSWRKIPGSTASEYSDKSYAQKNTIKALEDALERRKLKGEVSVGLFPGSFRVKYDIKGKPLVSILIPTKDKAEYIKRCITSILEKTTYTNYEIIIIDTGSSEQETLDFYKTINSNKNIKFLHWNKKFNYSSVNNFGAKNAKGEYLLLLNNDTEVITPEWIEGMLEHAQGKEVGAVGVKLYYPDNRVQHAGVILGINGGTGRGVAGHAFKFFGRDVQGFPVQKDIIRDYSAVTAACLMIRKKKFDEVKGLEDKFRIAFNDVDFCLKLKSKGYYNVFTPYVELYHHESVSVGTPESNTRDNDEFGKEIDLMYEKWEDNLENDPYFNQNLSKTSESFLIKT